MNAGTMGVVAFFTGHILGDLFWYAAVSTAIWKGRRLLSDRGYRLLILSCAVCLIVFSCLFAWSGMQKTHRLTGSRWPASGLFNKLR